MTNGLVLSADISFVYPHLDVLLGVLRQIGQRNHWSVEELRQHVPVELLLVLVVRLDVNYLEISRSVVHGGAIVVTT